MKWNGRSYRPPGYGIKVYPTKQDSITELLKPLGEKTRKGNVWVPVLNQPLNVLKESGTPTPVVSASPTPTPSVTPSSTPPEASPSPTPTGTGTATPTPTQTGTPTPTPSTLPPTSVSYRTNVTSTSNNSTYTFSSVNFGAVGLVVIAINAKKETISAGWDISSVTIDGVSATRAVIQGGFNSMVQGIYYAVVTNTTGNIVVNFNANANSINVGVWRIDNYNSTSPVYTGTTQGVTSSLSIETTTLTPTSVGITAGIDGSYPNNITWANATERYEWNNGDIGNQQDTTGADFTQSTSGTRTVTLATLSTTGALLQLAIWR